MRALRECMRRRRTRDSEGGPRNRSRLAAENMQVANCRGGASYQMAGRPQRLQGSWKVEVGTPVKVEVARAGNSGRG
eukprot:5800408-Pyramimonas_sp.AAC.1